MNQKDAAVADNILRFFAQTHEQPITVKFIMNQFHISVNDSNAYIKLFLADKLIEPIRHPGAPNTDFGVYFLSDAGVRFILFAGGYCKKRRLELYANQNIKFTWIRHWAWFFAFIISFCLNVYFLLLKALE